MGVDLYLRPGAAQSRDLILRSYGPDPDENGQIFRNLVGGGVSAAGAAGSRSQLLQRVAGGASVAGGGGVLVGEGVILPSPITPPVRFEPTVWRPLFYRDNRLTESLPIDLRAAEEFALKRVGRVPSKR